MVNEHLPTMTIISADTQGKYRELKAFIEESALMCTFHHPHVMGTVGICLDTFQSPYLLLPYMANGDLRTFLRNKRDTANSSNTTYPEVSYTLPYVQYKQEYTLDTSTKEIQ